MTDLPSDPFLALIGVKTSVVIASAFGGVVSAMITTGGTFIQRATTAVVGGATSIYLTPLAIELCSPWLPAIQRGQLEHASAFICGLLGMSIAQGLFNLGRAFKRHPLEVIIEALSRGKLPPT